MGGRSGDCTYCPRCGPWQFVVFVKYKKEKGELYCIEKCTACKCKFRSVVGKFSNRIEIIN